MSCCNRVSILKCVSHAAMCDRGCSSRLEQERLELMSLLAGTRTGAALVTHHPLSNAESERVAWLQREAELAGKYGGIIRHLETLVAEQNVRHSFNHHTMHLTVVLLCVVLQTPSSCDPSAADHRQAGDAIPKIAVDTVTASIINLPEPIFSESYPCEKGASNSPVCRHVRGRRVCIGSPSMVHSLGGFTSSRRPLRVHRLCSREVRPFHRHWNHRACRRLHCW